MKRTFFIVSLAAHIGSPGLPAKDTKSPKPMSERQIERMQKRNEREAQEAWVGDNKRFSKKEFSALENDYQEISKNYRAPEIREILERFLEKYKKGNRVGCAMLYLAQKSRGQEKGELLEKVIQGFSDSYYLNGCSVGGLARLQLAHYYQSSGKESDAVKLAEDIRKNYRTAQDHQGRPVIDQLEGIGK